MLTRLAAHRFRNLEGLDWELPGGSCLLLGSNGAGKTSVLEAVHLVATTRSFRTAQLGECVTRAGDASTGFHVRAEVSGEPRAVLELAWTPAGLERTLDGKTAPLATYLEALPVIAWTAREEEILAGVPERRRRMLDAGIVTERPARIDKLARFRRALVQKRELLKRGVGGLREWNEVFVVAAADLIAERRAYVERLASRLESCLSAAGLAFPAVSLVYEPSLETAEGDGEALRLLAEIEPEERRMQRPLRGPHLDRLTISWGGVEVSRVASAGERKALGLLLVAAQAELLEELGRPPLVLADDLDAELDLAVLGAVWGVLSRNRTVLASSNREAVFEVLGEVSVLRLAGGRAVPESRV